jgi:hypothetical protein
MKLQGFTRGSPGILLARLLAHYRGALSGDQLRSIAWQTAIRSCP